MKNFAEYLGRYAQPLILASTFVSSCPLACSSADPLCIQQIDAHARAGRASDLNSIRKELHTYVPEATLENGIKIPPLRSSQVRQQDPSVGYKSITTGRLVVNINERDEFDRDPQRYVCHTLQI